MAMLICQASDMAKLRLHVLAHAGSMRGDSEEVWDWLLWTQGLLWDH